MAASGFGIFLTGDDDTTGMTLQTVITSINQEYIQRIQEIEAEHQPYDSVAIYGSEAPELEGCAGRLCGHDYL